VTDDDRVFKALADPTRCFLLDRLFARDGRTLTELESELEMTRFGVMKHLRVLEDAGLVVPRRSGREKLHFLNPSVGRNCPKLVAASKRLSLVDKCRSLPGPCCYNLRHWGHEPSTAPRAA
jgi:DNA-binding transcriptional ArsR family regulator